MRSPLGRLTLGVARAAIDASRGTLAVISRQVVPVNGVGTPVFSLRAADGDKPSPIPLALVAGRAPRTAGEIAVGPATAREIHAKVSGPERLRPQCQDVAPVSHSSRILTPERQSSLWMPPGRARNRSGTKPAGMPEDIANLDRVAVAATGQRGR